MKQLNKFLLMDTGDVVDTTTGIVYIPKLSHIEKSTDNRQTSNKLEDRFTKYMSNPLQTPWKQPKDWKVCSLKELNKDVSKPLIYWS